MSNNSMPNIWVNPGLSPAGVERECRKKMDKTEIPPQDFPITPLYHIQDFRLRRKNSSQRFLETAPSYSEMASFLKVTI